jgi:hypothetical protein
MYDTLSAGEIGVFKLAGSFILGAKNEKKNKKNMAEEKTYIFIGCR